jgi:tetratricopeptide (TPR) repeat protein
MSSNLKAIRVFIASPGGLAEERRQFRQTLTEFNEDDGYERGIAFIPVGWETTVEGAGRAQSIINDEIRRCDYIVLVLCDRWGTPPGIGAFSSGTEEEYAVARECLLSAQFPMRDILVLFKGVPDHQMSDPGEELRRVLAFRSRIERSHEVFHRPFDALSEFERIIRRHLQEWAREHEHGESIKTPRQVPEPPQTGLATVRPDPAKRTDEVIRDAQSLRREGRVVDAEALLATAVVERSDIEALDAYARLLRKTGRVARSTATSQRQLQLAQDRDDSDAVIDAYINLGLSKRKLGDLAGSILAWREGINFAERSRPTRDHQLGYLYDNLGLTLRRAGRLDESRRSHEHAIALRETTDDREGLAHSCNNLGILLLELDHPDQAEAFHRKAQTLFEDLDDLQGAGSAVGNLGMALQAVGKFDEAETAFEQALALNRKTESQRGLAITEAQLARLMLATGRLGEAESHASRCLELNEAADDQLGIATAFHILGELEIAEGRSDASVELLGASIRIFEDMGYEIGRIRGMTSLAKAEWSRGNVDAAREAARSADARAGELGLRRTRADVRRLLAELETS